jgi:hypothetical protein
MDIYEENLLATHYPHKENQREDYLILLFDMKVISRSTRPDRLMMRKRRSTRRTTTLG